MAARGIRKGDEVQQQLVLFIIEGFRRCKRIQSSTLVFENPFFSRTIRNQFLSVFAGYFSEQFIGERQAFVPALTNDVWLEMYYDPPDDARSSWLR